MCVSPLSSSDHPSIIKDADNRFQEYLHRPTAPANWWPDGQSHVLGARDLAREVHGTWLGITKQGRVAVLTNYREKSSQAVGLRSRGSIVNGFLGLSPDSEETTEQYVDKVI